MIACSKDVSLNFLSYLIFSSVVESELFQESLYINARFFKVALDVYKRQVVFYVNGKDFALFAFIFSSDYFNSVAFFNLHS